MPDSLANAAQNYLCFDFGRLRTGVAVGQRLTGTASPVITLTSHNNKPDWPHIAALLEDWRPAALVVGLPYNADGSEQPLTDEARRFARQLEGRFGLPVHLADERYSSAEAEEALRENRQAGRRRVRKSDIDAVAACLILESWFRTRSE